MHSAYRITFILLLCLGLALEQSYAKTVTSHTGPCKGENCPLEHSLDPSAEGGQNQVENMAQEEPGRNTEEHAEKTKEETNGNTKTEPMEDIPGGGRPEEVGSEKTESSLPPPLEEEHGTESNQEHGELNKPEATSTGNTEERPPEAKNEEEEPKQESHRIDPEAVPHRDDGGHVVQETEAQSGNGEISRLEPSPEKELHGGVEDVHSGAPDLHREEENPDSGKEEEEESGPDLDAVLHGGDRHAHAPAPVNDNPDMDSRGEFGVDPERVMHPEGGGAHVHAARRGPAHRGLVHSDSAPHRDPAHRDSAHSDGSHDYATDIESVLHGGEKHVHAPDARIQDDDDDDLPEVPVGATDLEAMVHGGDGHAHSQPRPDRRTDPEPRPYGAQDPESVLHGSDDHEHRIRQEAVDGSRPMPSRTDPDPDPDASPTDVDPEDVRIGTLRPEDGDDYRQWKAEKERDASSSWFSGFTYLKEGFWRDLRAAKDRYLARLWSGEGGTDDGKPARAPHDEP